MVPLFPGGFGPAGATPALPKIATSTRPVTAASAAPMTRDTARVWVFRMDMSTCHPLSVRDPHPVYSPCLNGS